MVVEAEKIKVELSLREARALARAVSAAATLVYDPRLSGPGKQSEVFNALAAAERALQDAVAGLSDKRGGDFVAGYKLAASWAKEPLAAPFGRVVIRKEVA